MSNGVKKYAKDSKTILRRKSVIERLENQLKSGVKTTKEGDLSLTDSDINRIKKEIETLKLRLV